MRGNLHEIAFKAVSQFKFNDTFKEWIIPKPQQIAFKANSKTFTRNTTNVVSAGID